MGDDYRIGWGYDVHRLVADGRVELGGVVVDDHRGVDATSDGDVLAHAVADALLGAAALGDLGTYFPSEDPAWADADSMLLLGQVVGRVGDAGYAISSIDTTVIAQTVRVAPHRQAIRESLAAKLHVAVDRVSVKATTTDGLGFVGRDEGIAVHVVAVIRAT